MNDNLNLNTIKMFYTVAKSKSFHEASNLLYISQPAISKSIKKLESDLGTKLFFRNKSGIELTNDGKILLDYVEKSFANLNAGLKLLNLHQNLDHGKIVIGIPSHIASFYLLNYIEKFKSKYPNINIEIISSSTKLLLKDLEDHKLDFVIDSSPIDNLYPSMKIKKISKLKTCFVANKKVSIQSIKDIANMDLILPVKKSSIRKNLEKELSRYDIILQPKIEVETTDLILSATRRGMGVGYIFEMALDNYIDNHHLFILDFKESLPEIDVNLIYVESCLPYASKKFIDEYLKG